MIRRIRPPHVLQGAFDKLKPGELYILDCRNIDIEWTIRMMIRNAPEGMVGCSIRPGIGAFAIRGAEREARRRGARIFWLPPGPAVEGVPDFIGDRNVRDPKRLFQFGWFTSHSGFQLPWKFVLDGKNIGWEDLAELVAGKFVFSSVHGIPKGGNKFAAALAHFAEPDSGYPPIIVDDVGTTGNSFIDAKAALGDPEGCIGITVCARGKMPNWVWSILSVNEWAQCRATGLG